MGSLPITTARGIVERDAREPCGRAAASRIRSSASRPWNSLSHPRRSPARPRAGRARCGCPGPTAGSPSPAASESNAPPPAATRPWARPASHSSVPDALAHRELPVQLPAQLAGVGDALGPHRRHLADVQVARRHVGERLVRQVGVRDRREDVARTRAPQPQREQRPGALGDRDALTVADLGAQPGQVVRPDYRRPSRCGTGPPPCGSR